LSIELLVYKRIQGGTRRISVINIGDGVIVALSKPERMTLIMINAPANGRLLTLDSARGLGENGPHHNGRKL